MVTFTAKCTASRLVYLLVIVCGVCAEKYEHALLYGNVEDLGYYYVDIRIGTPPKKQTVIVDTGSGLTAFPCADCTDCAHLVKCSGNYRCTNKCDKDKDVCNYAQSYLEGSSISGYLVKDYVYFGDESEDRVKFVFGCHTRETHLFRTQKADGIMGLHIEPATTAMPTLIDALYKHADIQTDLFSLCLGRENGLMTIGGYNKTIHESTMQFIRIQDSMYYKVQFDGVKVNDQEVKVAPGTYTTYGRRNTDTIIDSGTTFTYFHTALFNGLTALFETVCAQPEFCEGERLDDHCYRWDKGVITAVDDFLATFPLITLVFEGKDVILDPANYMYWKKGEPGVYCLGFFTNGGGQNVIGMISMRGQDFVFDRGANRIGIAESNCDLAHYSGFKDFGDIAPVAEDVRAKGGIMSLLFYFGLAMSIALMAVLICGAVYSYFCEGEDDYAIKEDESVAELDASESDR